MAMIRLKDCLPTAKSSLDRKNCLCEKAYLQKRHNDAVYIFSCVSIHPGRVEPASSIDDVSWVSAHRSPGVAAFRGFAAQAKLSLPGLRALERPLFTYTTSLLV